MRKGGQDYSWNASAEGSAERTKRSQYRRARGTGGAILAARQGSDSGLNTRCRCQQAKLHQRWSPFHSPVRAWLALCDSRIKRPILKVLKHFSLWKDSLMAIGHVLLCGGTRLEKCTATTLADEQDQGAAAFLYNSPSGEPSIIDNCCILIQIGNGATGL